MFRQNPVASTFLTGVAIALTTAWLAPDIGKSGGAIPSKAISNAGIMAIFFLQGVGLPTEQFGRSLVQWRLHLFAQLFCFAAIPLITWLLLKTVGSTMPPDLALGFLFLSILPMTISSATVMVGLAGGDVPSAIFNTAFSNLIGVLIVPIAASWILATGTAAEIPLAPLLTKVALLILIPMVIGQVARPKLKNWAAHHKKRITTFNNLVIFFLLYSAFCNAFSTSAPSGETLTWALAGSTLLFAAITALAWFLAKPFPLPQRIAALYCSSQKTLAAGMPLALAIYAAGNPAALPPLATFILPLICFHPLQLVLGGILTGKFAARTRTL